MLLNTFAEEMSKAHSDKSLKKLSFFCGGNVQCLAWWGAVWQSTIKNLHPWWRIIWREIVLLMCLNTFAEEMSKAHSDKLRKLSFFAEAMCSA